MGGFHQSLQQAIGQWVGQEVAHVAPLPDHALDGGNFSIGVALGRSWQK